ncbi:MAG: helix-turn-helix transcriptional regulator, partial [Firmicutes bacterium]|nr:helix-turn-helix transcriptional regulator [Bacillota bacterium]
MRNRRQEILSKAREMFSQRSFHAVSLEDITRSLGMG